MTATVAYKRDHTTRVPALATTDDGPLLLALLDIDVKLENGDNLVTLELGGQVGLYAGDGQFWFEVTPADLVALGDPAQVLTTINIWNADNTLAMTGSGMVNVTL
jgi:hypothetical protein